MSNTFKPQQEVHLLGAPEDIGVFISVNQPSNTNLINVYVARSEAVYPYFGDYRLYSEDMLVPIVPKTTCLERVLDFIVKYG